MKAVLRKFCYECRMKFGKILLTSFLRGFLLIFCKFMSFSAVFLWIPSFGFIELYVLLKIIILSLFFHSQALYSSGVLHFTATLKKIAPIHFLTHHKLIRIKISESVFPSNQIGNHSITLKWHDNLITPEKAERESKSFENLLKH